MSMPIILIHRGDDEFLTYTLQQAKLSNPSSDVILLGKDVNKKYCLGIASHARIDDYMQNAHSFAKFYQHLSTNSYEYNMFCFQRWFVLLDYMKNKRIQKCCYMDSDVMLYTDINQPAYSQFAFEFSWTSIVDQNSLERFCNLILSSFGNPVQFTKLVQYTHQIGQVHNGQPLVSDMVLCALYLQGLGQFTHTHGLFGNSFFDGNISHPLRIPPGYDEVETIEGKKKVIFNNGSLYCRSKDVYIQVNSLHFQGPPMKPYMKYFVSSNIGFGKELVYFDYSSCRWLPANS